MANTFSTDLEVDLTQYWSASVSILPTGANADFTITSWIKTESTGAIKIICGQKSASEAGRFLFYVDSADKLTAFIGGVSTTVTGSTSLSTSTWYHVVVVRTGGTINLHINGNATPDGTGSDSSALSSANFAVGSDVVPESYFDGKINDIRVWSRALSTAEISSLYSAPCVFNNGSSLSGWWFISDALDSGKAHDESSNNNDLTNNGSAVFSTDTAYSCSRNLGFNTNRIRPRAFGPGLAR